MSVLVISHGKDAHIKFVAKHLSVELLQFDPQRFPLNIDITYCWNGKCFEISSNGRKISDVTSVWYRKPKLPDLSSVEVKPEVRILMVESCNEAVGLLYGLMQGKLWVNNPHANRRANNKLLQAEVAKSVGFNIPKTLATSLAEEAERFVSEVSAVVVKPLCGLAVRVDDYPHMVYTTRITSRNDLSFKGLNLSPVIFQEEIEKLLDIRITVVGDSCFACGIRQLGELADAIDWRKGIGSKNLSYEVFNLPEHIQDMCLKVTRKLGLVFGAIDLVLHPDGSYWFLEINPNGQWGFVERHTGLPIGKAMAQLLEDGK